MHRMLKNALGVIGVGVTIRAIGQKWRFTFRRCRPRVRTTTPITQIIHSDCMLAASCACILWVNADRATYCMIYIDLLASRTSAKCVLSLWWVNLKTPDDRSDRAAIVEPQNYNTTTRLQRKNSSHTTDTNTATTTQNTALLTRTLSMCGIMTDKQFRAATQLTQTQPQQHRSEHSSTYTNAVDVWSNDWQTVQISHTTDTNTATTTQNTALLTRTLSMCGLMTDKQFRSATQLTQTQPQQHRTQLYLHELCQCVV